MYIFMVMIKLILVKWRRLVLSAASILLFSIIIGFLGNMLLYNSKLIEPFTVAVIDNDKTFETGVLISTIKSLEYVKDIAEITEATEAEAIDLLNSNEIAAYVIFPENFSSDVKTGVNPPVEVVCNASNKVRTLIVQLFIESSTEYLSSLQSGVYAVHDYSYNLIDKDKFSKLIMDINLEYLSIVLGREEMFDNKTISAAGNVSIFQYYLIAAIIFFALLNATLFTDVLQSLINNNILRKIKITGQKLCITFLSVIAACFCCYFVFNILIAAILFAVFNIELTFNMFKLLGIITFFICLSVYTTAIAAIFNDSRQAGICNFVFCTASLFLSGGIVPLSFLPVEIINLAKITINYWGNDILTNISAYSGYMPVFALFLITIIFFIIGYLGLKRKVL